MNPAELGLCSGSVQRPWSPRSAGAGLPPSGAAAAGATTRVRLGFGVMIPPLHPVIWVAKQVASLQNSPFGIPAEYVRALHGLPEVEPVSGFRTAGLPFTRNTQFRRGPQ